MTATRPATAAELRELAASADALEAYITGPMALATGRALDFWAALDARARARLANDTRAANQELASRAGQLASIYRGLRSGALELAGWQPPEQELRLGVVRAGQLGMWPVVAVIAVGAVIAAGVWVVLDLWAEARKLEAEADLVRARTAADVQATVAKVAQTDPAAATDLARALAKAQGAANAATGGWLSRVGDALATGAETAFSSTGVLLALGALWFWSRGRR
jgi:hypothetical protein